MLNKINGVVTVLFATVEHKSRVLTLTEKCFCVFNQRLGHVSSYVPVNPVT